MNLGLMLSYIFWRKDDNISCYCSLYLQRIMDKWVQSDQDPLKYLHYVLGVIFKCEIMTDCNNLERILITSFP